MKNNVSFTNCVQYKNELFEIECTKNQFYTDQIRKFQQQHKKIQVNFLTKRS